MSTLTSPLQPIDIKPRRPGREVKMGDTSAKVDTGVHTRVNTLAYIRHDGDGCLQSSHNME